MAGQALREVEGSEFLFFEPYEMSPASQGAHGFGPVATLVLGADASVVVVCLVLQVRFQGLVEPQFAAIMPAVYIGCDEPREVA